EDLTVLRLGSREQPVLAKKGDDLRIDWGYLYLASPKLHAGEAMITRREVSVSDFAEAGLLLKVGQKLVPPGTAGSAIAAIKLEFARVGSAPTSRWLMLAYDDLYSIQYMRKNLRPYWRRNGWEAADLLKAAARDYESLKQRCEVFDEELMGG